MECTKCHLVKEIPKNKRWCKDCKNAYERERMKNKDIKEKSLEKEKEYYLKKKEKVKENPVEFDMTTKKTCSKCKETKTLDKFHPAKCRGNIRAACKSCLSKQRREYYQKNKEAVIKQTSNYQVEKMKIDPKFKLERYCRARIYNAIRNQSLNKNKRTQKYLGCNIDFFQKWIEFQLYDGMTMENYGNIWHIDHVKPCASYNLSDDKQVEECFNWKNLRPLLKEKNLLKSDNIDIFEITLQELKTKVFLKQNQN